MARALAADPPVMLMDEPFGAVDPINRERLQNEFLRLQTEIRKTVLFVTHDIDEAIKMGDRIAILQEGGRLAQYATPAELLMAPANDFVEDFVGADRALKRLALMRVRDIDLWHAPLAFVGQATGEVRAKLEGAEVPHALLVDSERRPIGWLSESDLQAETVPATPDSGPEPILDLDDVMRDALANLLQSETQYAPVTDRDGRIAGVLSIEIISDFLGSPEAKVEEHAAVERPVERPRRRMIAGPLQLAPTHRAGDDPQPDRPQRPLPGSGGQGVLSSVGDRQLRPLHDPVRSTSSCSCWSRWRIGFAVAFAFAVLSHRQHWLIPTFTGATGVLYTIPSLAFIFLLLPITGLGWETAIIVLSVYTLQIIYRNIVAGLANVPVGEQGRGTRHGDDRPPAALAR